MPRKRYSQPQHQAQASSTWGSWGQPVPEPAQPASPPPPSLSPPRSPSPVPAMMDYEEELPSRGNSTRSWVDDQFERGRSRAPSAASARSYAASNNSILGPRPPTTHACVSPPRSISPAARSVRSWASGSRPPSVAPSVGYAPSIHPPVSVALSARPPTSKAPSCDLGPLPAEPAFLGSPHSVDVTKATKLLSSSSPFVQQYAAVRNCLDMLRGADLEAMDPMIPKVGVVGKDEPFRARIVGSLTGVMLNRGVDVLGHTTSSPPFFWKVSTAKEVDDDLLIDVQDFAVQPAPAIGFRQIDISGSSRADLFVYDLPFGFALSDNRSILNTIFVNVGESPSPFESVNRRSIYVPKADDEASRDAAVQQCFEKLNKMLVDRLPDRVEALSQTMRKRVLELSQELTKIPASSKEDNAPRLSNMLTTFVDDLKKALGASNDAHSVLCQGVLTTRREFAMPPAPDDAPTRAPSPAGSRGTGHGKAANHGGWSSAFRSPVLPPPSHILPPPSHVLSPPPRVHSPPPPEFVLSPPSRVISPPSRVVSPPPFEPVLPPPSQVLPPPGMWLPPTQSIPAPPPRAISPPLEPFHPGPPSSHAIVEPTNLSVQDVMDRLDKARTNELPGHWPVHEVSSVLISETTQQWLEPSETYLNALMKLVVASSGKSVDGHFTSYTSSGLRAKVAGIVKAKILKCQQTTREVFAKVLEAEGRIAVEDDDAFLALKESYRERFRGQLSLEHLQAMGKCAAALDVMATVSAYFDVAHKRFLESLRRAAHTHLLDALTRDLASELMKAVDLTNAEKWLALPPETVNKRVELEDRLACLRRALDELSVALLL